MTADNLKIINHEPSISEFHVFNYMDKSIRSCSDAMNTNTNNMSDSQRGDVCCAECQWICWPMICVFDIVSCPIRGCYHLKQKCANHKR